jgi:hypothetical protein
VSDNDEDSVPEAKPPIRMAWAVLAPVVLLTLLVIWWVFE